MNWIPHVCRLENDGIMEIPRKTKSTPHKLVVCIDKGHQKNWIKTLVIVISFARLKTTWGHFIGIWQPTKQPSYEEIAIILLSMISLTIRNVFWNCFIPLSIQQEVDILAAQGCSPFLYSSFCHFSNGIKVVSSSQSIKAYTKSFLQRNGFLFDSLLLKLYIEYDLK